MESSVALQLIQGAVELAFKEWNNGDIAKIGGLISSAFKASKNVPAAHEVTQLLSSTLNSMQNNHADAQHYLGQALHASQRLIKPE